MKYKTLLLFCSLQLVACSLFSQVGVDSLYKSQTIGNTLRNQRCGNGLQIEDSLITNGISIFNDNVGIGTVSPDYKLQVAGSVFFEKTVGGRTAHFAIDTLSGFMQSLWEWTSGDTSNVMGITPGDAFMRANTDGTDYDVIMNISDPGGVKIQGKSTTTGNALTILEGDTTIFGGDTLYRFGNNGTMQVYGMAGSAQKIVTADATGVLDTASVAEISPWARDGTNVFLRDTTDNVGIGTSSPDALFQVVGSGGNTHEFRIDYVEEENILSMTSGFLTSELKQYIDYTAIEVNNAGTNEFGYLEVQSSSISFSCDSAGLMLQTTLGVDYDRVTTNVDFFPIDSASVSIGRASKPFQTIFTEVITSDVTNPPTDAELDAIYGTPATVGNGFTGNVKDSNSDNFYEVKAIGSQWYTIAATLAP